MKTNYINKNLLSDLTRKYDLIKKGESETISDEELMEYISLYKVKSEIDQKNALENILNQIEINETKREGKTKSIQIRHIGWALAAASVTILLGFFLLLDSHKQVIVNTEIGNVKKIYLSDSSEVIINASSQISYNRGSWNKSRSIKLEGEAYFKVNKGSKFEVLTPFGRVEVMGTSFNIVARNLRQFKVCCISGKVKVGTMLKSSYQILAPGYETSVSADSTLGQPVAFKTDKIIARQNGEFYFDEEPLSMVFQEFDRQYKIKIIYNGNPNRKYTGWFDNKDMEKALQNICLPMQLSFIVRDGIAVVQ